MEFALYEGACPVSRQKLCHDDLGLVWQFAVVKLHSFGLLVR